jgi:hypothetical protein
MSRYHEKMAELNSLDLNKAKAMSCVGCKVTYIPDNFAQTTEEMLVLEYDKVDRVYLVKRPGKPVQRFDLIQLFKSNKSTFAQKWAFDDPLFLEYTEETANEKKSRKAAVEAVQKIKRSAEPEEKIEDIGPSPRRPSRRPRSINPGWSCGICMEEDATYVTLQPCGHAPFCTDCAATLMNHANCPICRKHITGTQRIFFS